ncbi:hypothetical protein [Niabella drilacis]|uniref:hypothetical protein n=1 Tax=Niabella drilacis (strain DSM 25811 / CCM 8410 / CCUG 62505 / LMG 26954 / E90) TaxID=1285928 RepID=UPI00159FEA70|nr:hypothetical protein [Niabella drilacis]
MKSQLAINHASAFSIKPLAFSKNFKELIILLPAFVLLAALLRRTLHRLVTLLHT